jgi:hypothetical protein
LDRVLIQAPPDFQEEYQKLVLAHAHEQSTLDIVLKCPLLNPRRPAAQPTERLITILEDGFSPAV